MKRIVASLVALFALTIVASAQSLGTETVDMAKVEKLVTDSTLRTHYPKLVARYEAFEKMSFEEYRLLYYGFALQDVYTGYNNTGRSEMSAMLNSGSYTKLMAYCDSCLKVIPVSIDANLYRAIAMKKSGKSGSERYWDRIRMIFQIIASSGDGQSSKTAYKTIFVGDEYSFMYDYLGIEKIKGQALLYYEAEQIDRMSVKKSKTYKKKTVYFNTSETFKGMGKAFKTDN